MAAALVAMVARLTIGRKKYAAAEAKMMKLAVRADELRLAFSDAVHKDAAAFEAVMKAMKMPKETGKQKAARDKALQTATLAAAREPLAGAGLAVETLGLAVTAAELGNPNALSDAGTAAALARASLQGAALNVRINVHGLGKNATGVKLLKELRALEKKVPALDAKVQKFIQTRGGF
jgi:glutamate formiminotransferase/formiminotetrahydrofolate cyclodeaminase